jgi:UPF0716 protein FxsA
MRRPFRFRPGPLALGLCVWLACEVAAFVIVAQHVGFGGAILIGIATTILGLVTLRRVGMSAIRNLKRAFDGAQPTPGAMLDGALAALGATLLILPGFLSDLVGLALAAPSIRQWLAHRFGAVARPGRPPVQARPGAIDLAPDDWQRIEEAKAWPGSDDRPDPRGRS